jgi:hypothetical protein
MSIEIRRACPYADPDAAVRATCKFFPGSSGLSAAGHSMMATYRPSCGESVAPMIRQPVAE